MPIPETRASPSSAGHLIGRIPLGSACGASRRSRGAFSARCARSPRRLRRRRFLPEYEKNAKFPREPQGNYNSQLLCPHVLVPRSLLGQRGFCLSKDGEHKTLLDAAFANSASHLCGSYGFASHYGRWYNAQPCEAVVTSRDCYGSKRTRASSPIRLVHVVVAMSKWAEEASVIEADEDGGLLRGARLQCRVVRKARQK